MPRPPKNTAALPVMFIGKGATLVLGDREYVVLHLLDLNKVLARDVASGEKLVLHLDAATQSAPEPLSPPPLPGISLEDVSADDWEVAQHRYNLIKPLLGPRRARTTGDYEQVAKAAEVSRATIFRWVDAYRSSQLLSSLLPTHPSGGRGKSRLREEVRLILDDYIRSSYLTVQKPTLAAATREVRRRCDAAGLHPLPTAKTIQRYIHRIGGEERLRRREGAKAARERYRIDKSSIPDADWPLAMVQMDHTLLPVIIVDDQHRKPINRAWITLAIDVYSRVCLGMYLSLDPPSAMSAGMCLSHAILPKSAWLTQHQHDPLAWPGHGVMEVLHLDNAKEFRGNMLRTACAEYGIDIHLRPVKQPHYGAHIERLMGTVSQALKDVRGATFSGPKEKGTYDAEGNACLTLDELEQWLILLFARYHREMHAGIGTTPDTRWREGTLGNDRIPMRGLPGHVGDVAKVRLDFMPYMERTIQAYGVVINRVYYYSDVLRSWIDARDPDNPRSRRYFKFRYDPRDMSQLYFFDPDAQRYFAIPYRDSSLPPVSIWELRAARKKAKEIGVATYDEREVFAIVAKQRELENEAASKVKSARRAEQRRKQQERARKANAKERPKPRPVEDFVVPPALLDYDPSIYRPKVEDDDGE